ncbi:MAG: hypothetical protein ACRD7E_02460 [Bryobacteraceae bacterium]
MSKQGIQALSWVGTKKGQDTLPDNFSDQAGVGSEVVLQKADIRLKYPIYS